MMTGMTRPDKTMTESQRMLEETRRWLAEMRSDPTAGRAPDPPESGPAATGRLPLQALLSNATTYERWAST